MSKKYLVDRTAWRFVAGTARVTQSNGNPEFQLQCWYAQWLRLLGVLFCANLGGVRVSLFTAKKLKASGYQKGVPDIIIYEPRGLYHGMAVELKCGSYPSGEQKVWRDALNRRGYYAVIVPGKLDYDQARSYLERETEEYLKL